MNFIKSIFFLVKSLAFFALLTFAILLISANREVVKVNLFPFPFEIETKVFLLVIAVFLTGFLMGFLTCSRRLLSELISGFKNRRRIKKLEKLQ